MELFVWDESYLTGVEMIDSQHHRLVDLINAVGERLAGDEVDVALLKPLFDEMRDYAAHHFAEEEQLMAARGISHRHRSEHAGQHRSFIAQIETMWQSRHMMQHPAETIHGFLTSWLIYHILGEDKVLVRQFGLIEAGRAPEEAHDVASLPEDKAVGALLMAMRKMYRLLSEQHRAIASANAHLNELVAERTRELEAANAYLTVEHETAKQLLTKVDEAQSQVLQSEKMASIGQLAAGVAHEINNPIGFVNSNLGMLKQYSTRLLELVGAYEATEGALPEAARSAVAAAKQKADLDYLKDDIPDLLRESEDGLARVKKIVQDLKDFSRVGEVEWQDADLVDGLESTLNVVWNEIKYKAEVLRELTPLPLVRCVPAQLNQVFMNLLVNAAQAIEERGTITLKSGVDNDHAWIEIADTGKGMTAEVRRRIFEPFYTTKPVGKGTGLGLSVSYDIVAKHGGSIDVHSELGKGTAFRVWLPIGGPAPAQETAS